MTPTCTVYSHPDRSGIKLKEALQKARHILIVGHNNPDGDSVGSAMALHAYLKNAGKDSLVIFPNACAQNLLWMDTDNCRSIFTEQQKETEKRIDECDLLLALDLNRLSRTEGMSKRLENKEVCRIMIDHHLEPDLANFDLVYSDTSVSSTCELLYRVIADELDPALIDKHVAECLYAGISTDTGSFSYSCGHKELFDTISNLVAKGLDTVKVHQLIFDNFSESRIRLLGCCLSERLTVKPEYHTAYMFLSDEDMRKYHYQSGDTEGIVNYGLSIEGIKFAAFFTQREKRIRISFRSQGNIDVNGFARDHFNGGGHKNAAGGTSYDSVEDTLAKFEALLPDFYEHTIKPNL